MADGVWQRSEVAAEISRADERLWHEVVGILPDATKDDIIGSAYAVKAYRVDERFGGKNGLAIFESSCGPAASSFYSISSPITHHLMHHG